VGRLTNWEVGGIKVDILILCEMEWLGIFDEFFTQRNKDGKSCNSSI
jgi:hypothetical protein